MLHYVTYNAAKNPCPLIVAHGLFGSSRNWSQIAKQLSDIREVIVVDMRNHGQSPWSTSHSYEDMADDLAEIIELHGESTDLIGHSMGGKAAMVLSLRYPHLVRRLLVADIAPVTYGHDHSLLIAAMRSVELSHVSKRSDATLQLAAQGIEIGVQNFLCQSLDVAQKAWQLNLAALESNMGKILSFPEISRQWHGSVLFLSGGASDYVRPEYRPRIRNLFPRAQFAKLRHAGHWLHAEDPKGFEQTARMFLQGE
ncbi:MAG: alpha/beta fold hydrolase [Aestuariivita sp.]|nr:alpha/beta fold hydrolase [Aestuariivita sp.]MCY4345996.1 alpha/beta fold hydrolase [Aestuariivita sp.]